MTQIMDELRKKFNNVGNNDYNIRVQLQSQNRTNIDDVLLVVPSFYLLIDKFKNSYARKGEGI